MATSNVHTLMDMVKDYAPPVDTAYNSLRARKGFYKSIRRLKADHRATFFVEHAKRNLSDGDTTLALQYFTRAITTAENDSNKLSDCYSERANFLRGLDYWEKSGEDIKRTFRCQLINVDSPEFNEIVHNTLSSKPRRIFSAPVRRLPRIPDYEVNRTFPCSTTNIRIVNGEAKGQRVIATSRLHINENIVVEKPLVIASGEHESILFCHECMLFCVNPVPCSGCVTVSFCGEVCKESAWERYHKYECAIQYITDRHKHFRLAMKIALLFHDYIDLREDGSHCPEGYRDIMNKEISLEDFSDEIKNHFALFAAQVFQGLKNRTTFFRDIKNKDKFKIFKGLMMKLMFVVKEYKLEFVKTYAYHCGKILKDFTVSFFALYPFATNFRTGCAPNVSINYAETTLVVKTLRVIQPGEELFIAGKYHYTVTPKEERQAIFQMKYSTVCKCEACENNWPLGKDLERIYKSEISFSLHMLNKRLDETLALQISVENLHARTTDNVGVYLVGPSLEWLYWQTFLFKSHQRLSLNCESVMDFFRRKYVSRENRGE